jgi:chemotaxis methyl-accepting protein methylase
MRKKMTSKNKKSVQTQTPKTTKKLNSLEAKKPAEPKNRPQSLTVVGIGASAGGLTALNAFFDALSPDTGAAFVVVTHLHPKYESHLAELLQQHTQMPTRQVNKRTKVEANHVYVIPPNRTIILTDTHLETAEFTEPRGRRSPIDYFFRSLVNERRESISIILSGGGTDGAVGIKDVKEQGGLIMVQEPSDAEYDSMPLAAINTGLVDVVLPAGQLAEKLMDFVQHRPRLPHDPGQLTDEEAQTFQHILAHIYARTGQDFNQYKRTTILRRVERRMQLNGFTTLADYLGFLRQSTGEVQFIFNDILIGVTNFFRDSAAWLALEQEVIPELFQTKEESQIRVWSIGCATGEEAYGVAMLLFEEAERLNVHPHFQVFASDLDERSIAQARKGIYPAAIEADVSPERLERFFFREDEHYHIKREIRDRVLFTNHNILRDPPFSRQDLIVCRNLLDLLQKSVEFKVVECSDQIETQGKSGSAIAIPLTQNTKHFQFAKNMLNHNPLASQRTVFLLFLFGQRMIFGFLERRLTVFMQVGQALVPSIRQDSNVLCNVKVLVLEQLKVMLAAITKGSGYDFGRFWVGNQLRFLSVTFLFAAVVLFLAFFGRSIGCSLTSTRITSKTVSVGWSVFLPGRRNFCESTRASSTLRMVRHTVASLTP